MNPLSVTVETTVAESQATAFEYIVPIDLSSIFTGYGFLPAVTGTQHQTGAWDAAGQTRTVHLADHSSARELLTKYEYPSYFSYTVSDFTGSLGLLASSANGEWWFSTHASGQTNIKWHYAFSPRSVFTLPVLWFVANFLWRGYMTKALALSVQQIQRSAT